MQFICGISSNSELKVRGYSKAQNQVGENCNWEGHSLRRPLDREKYLGERELPAYHFSNSNASLNFLRKNICN